METLRAHARNAQPASTQDVSPTAPTEELSDTDPVATPQVPAETPAPEATVATSESEETTEKVGKHALRTDAPTEMTTVSQLVTAPRHSAKPDMDVPVQHDSGLKRVINVFLGR